MGNLETNLDRTLKLLYDLKKIDDKELRTHKEIDNVIKCINLLWKEGYVHKDWGPPDPTIYSITTSGEKFHEDGGFAAPRKYNEEVLRVTKKSLDIAIAAFVISVLALLLSILFGILQI